MKYEDSENIKTHSINTVDFNLHQIIQRLNFFGTPSKSASRKYSFHDVFHLVRYCNTKTSRNGVNNMWILKNSTSLLSSLDQLDVRTAKSVQTFDFSTLYTSIPHDLLKSRISNLVHNAFRKKDGSVRYTHIKLTRAKGYFTHDINGGGDNMFTADSICEMIEFLIDNIFVQFGGRLFRQVIGIPMGTNCAPLLADLFLYSYENEFLDNMIRSGHRRLARSFNLCYRYIDDLIVFNNKKFLDYLKEIYPSQLTVEKANKSDHLADYLDLTFIIDSGGKLSTRLYDKRDDFDFHIVNFPFLSSNIPSGPSYGVYISQLIRYARCCSHYDDFRYRHKCLVDRLLSKGYKALRLEKSFKKFYGRYHRISLRNIGGQSMQWRAIHSQDNFYLTCSRNLVAFVIYMDLSILKLIASCDGCHA